MISVSLKSLIAPQFYDVHKSLKQELYTHHWLKGGRGSTKSSFVSIEIVLGIMRDAEKGIMSNAIVIRRVKDTLAGSVYEQVKWAIYALHAENQWNIPDSKLQMTYLPTGQVILFKGADKEKKLKSTKVSKGYLKYLWYEEVDEFEGDYKIRNINQSIMRGGDKFVVFYTFNPPQSQRNWVNKKVTVPRGDTLVHHSTYLDVDPAWLGPQFIAEAEHLRKTNREKYEHDYLGKVTGTGAEVFTNLDIREITDDEIERFDRLKQGLDFGFAGDPLAFVKTNYDKTRRRLFIFGEVYGLRISNRKAVDMIRAFNPLNRLVIADSAEPRTINEFKLLGMNITGAKKGADSVDNGIKFLQDLDSIIIDPVRCPNTAREFNDYEIEKDRFGNLKGDFPDKDNHTIDAVRYALESEYLKRKARASKRRF